MRLLILHKRTRQAIWLDLAPNQNTQEVTNESLKLPHSRRSSLDIYPTSIFARLGVGAFHLRSSEVTLIKANGLPHFTTFVRSSLCRRQNFPNICTLFCLVHYYKAFTINLLCVSICVLERQQSSLFSIFRPRPRSDCMTATVVDSTEANTTGDLDCPRSVSDYMPQLLLILQRLAR